MSLSIFDDLKVTEISLSLLICKKKIVVIFTFHESFIFKLGHF